MENEYNYILKVYHKSKYFGFTRSEFKEFERYEDLKRYVIKKKLRQSEYVIYSVTIL